MSLTLEEAKEIVATFTEDRANGKVFTAGVIMLAPMIKSFETDDIIEATGYKRNTVERVISNLVRFGVWGEDHWAAEWPAFFVETPEEMSDERFQKLAMSFLLDAMVGAGELVRYSKDEEYMYRAINV